MNILITSAGRRVSLVRAFKTELIKYHPNGKVFTTDLKPEISPACVVSDGFFSVPRVIEYSYCSKLLDLCLDNGIGLVIPTIDTELLVLSKHIDEFKKKGIDIIVSSSEWIERCRDKRKTHSFFDSINFPRAKDADLITPLFPIFAKPYDGSCSKGIRIIKNTAELDNAKKEDNLMFLEYLAPEMHTEYTIDLYFDKNSILKCLVPRERIEIRGGEVSKGVTRKNEVYDIVKKYFQRCIGFRGCITLQIFLNNSTKAFYGIEINPRFGGGYPLSYNAGANFPNMIIKEYFAQESIDFKDDWKDRLLMLRYDDEILVDDYKG